MVGIHEYEKRVTAMLETIQDRLDELEAPLSSDGSYPSLIAGRAALAGPRKALGTERLAIGALLRNIQTKLKTYGLKAYDVPEGLTLENLTAAWTVWTEAEATRKRDFTRRIRQLQDQLRTDSARVANHIHSTLELATADLNAIEGPLSEQLVAAKDLQSRLRHPDLDSDLVELSQLEGECLACGIDDGDNDQTVHDAATLAETRQAVLKAATDRVFFVENQVVARSMTSVTPEQKEEFESAFRTFDRDESNTLDMDELAGALASLGISDFVSRMLRHFRSRTASLTRLPLQNPDEIQAHLGDEQEVGFEAFLKFLVDRAEDRLTGTKVRTCFRSAANEKGYLTELDLARLELPASTLDFLKARMDQAPLDGSEDPAADPSTVAFDFEEFLDRFLE